MDNITWSLYVNEYIDRKITPYGLELIDRYLRDFSDRKKRPKRTKIQGIYQRSLVIKTPEQAFLNKQEDAYFNQMQVALEEASVFPDKKGKSSKSNGDKLKLKTSSDQSFEAFLIERILLEDRRRQKADGAFYRLIKEVLTGPYPSTDEPADERSAKRAASHLVKEAKLPKNEGSARREWTQIYLLHAWVDLLCLRITPHLSAY